MDKNEDVILFESEAITDGVEYSSDQIKLRQPGATIQVDVTLAGSISAGTVKLQCKIDPSMAWVDVANTEQDLTNTTTKTGYIYNLYQQYYPIVRVVISTTGDDATANIGLFEKPFQG